MMRKDLKSLQSECVIYWTRKGESLFILFGLMILFQFETLPRQREIQTLSSAGGKDEITEGTKPIYIRLKTSKGVVASSKHTASYIWWVMN